MTLDTRIGIATNRDAFEIFEVANEIIQTGWKGGKIRHKFDEDLGDMNEGGQGLPGWLMVKSQPCWVEVSLDTAYGYKAENGAGCSDLHAWFILELAKRLKLDEQGIRWFWLNEFEGTWNTEELFDERWPEEWPSNRLKKFGDHRLGTLPT